jgi:hypothetical protein
MPATYEKIATSTVSGSSTSLISFSSITSAYTDLRLILNVVSLPNGSDNYQIWFNSDQGTNYSQTLLLGNYVANSVTSTRYSGQSIWWDGFSMSSNKPTFITLDILSYSNTSVYKTGLMTSAADTGDNGANLRQSVQLWRSTAAISTVNIKMPGVSVFGAGTKATLYGILKA